VRSPQRIELPLEPLTADAGRALSYLKRFGSVTVLNGHIHQIIKMPVIYHRYENTEWSEVPHGTQLTPPIHRYR